MKKLLFIISFIILLGACTSSVHQELPFQNTELTFEERADDLLSRMSLQDKINQLNYESKAVESLGVPEYNWWNECLHGVARSGIATVYPQAIGLASTWVWALVNRVSTALLAGPEIKDT